MDDIGNILYVVIVLLSIIFSAFRKKKKPTAPPPVSKERKSRPVFDPMKEFETFLEKFEEDKPQEKIEEPEIVEDTKKTEYVPVEEVKNDNPYLQHLEDERFQEAVPQTFSDANIYSDDIKDIASQDNTDNVEPATERTFDEQIKYEKNLRKAKKYFKNFSVKDAIIYSTIINRPYQ